MRVKCLAQEHNTLSPARVRTRTARSGVERTNHEATAPPTVSKWILVQNLSNEWVWFTWKWTYRQGTFSYEWFRFDTDTKANSELAYSKFFFNTLKYKNFLESRPTAETLFNMSVPIPLPVKKKTQSSQMLSIHCHFGRYMHSVKRPRSNHRDPNLEWHLVNGLNLSAQYGHVMLVNGYLVLTGVNLH